MASSGNRQWPRWKSSECTRWATNRTCLSHEFSSKSFPGCWCAVEIQQDSALSGVLKWGHHRKHKKRLYPCCSNSSDRFTSQSPKPISVNCFIKLQWMAYISSSFFSKESAQRLSVELTICCQGWINSGWLSAFACQPNSLRIIQIGHDNVFTAHSSTMTHQINQENHIY